MSPSGKLDVAPARRPLVAIAVAFVLLLTAGGCAGGGGGSATATGTSASAGTAGTGTSATGNAAQWRVALAALAAPQPLRLEPATLAVYDGLLAAHWPHARTLVDAAIEQQLRSAVGTALSGVRILSIRGVTLDLAAPPALAAAPGSGAAQPVALELPAAPGVWAVHVDADIGGTIPINIAGVNLSVAISFALRASVTDIRLRQDATLDVSRPAWPTIAGHGSPQVDFRLALSSPDPLLSTVAATLTRILDPIVRVALVAGQVVAYQQIGVALAGLPSSHDWGRGGPPLPAPAGAPDLAAIAERLSDDIQAFMSPWGHVYPTEFDQPNAGGNVVRHRHFGDSALWTGGTLCAEALRYGATGGDPRALAAATRLLRGIELLSEVVPAPFEGLLARCAVPLGNADSAQFGTGDADFLGSAGGVPYWCSGDPSRDSYTGVMAGLGQVVARIPSLRADAARVAGRLLEQLERHGWAVYQAPGQLGVVANQGGVPHMSVSFLQSPALLLGLTHVAASGDPARWSATLARHGELASMLWFLGWTSSHEVHEGYFGFSLEHFSLLTCATFETDPVRYRGYLQLLDILRDTLGHHQNPWFNAAYGAIVPAAGAGQAPDVRAALELWSRRPRRGFDCKNSLDPTIPHAPYTTTTPNQTGGPSQPLRTGPRTQLVAVVPVPIDRRPPTAFLWSSSPFDLDGWEDPYVQNPGVDLLLPYWVARCYGMLP